VEPTFSEWQRQPRPLLYRSHYKWYAVFLAALWIGCLASAVTFFVLGVETYRDEMLSFVVLSVLLPMIYLVWLHPKLTRTMQVFSDCVRITSKKVVFDINFADLESLSRPYGSLIRLRTKDGLSWTFSAALERMDYLWEALWRSRPELVGNSKIYEEFRLSLVQYDHHEKRKEWFFRHRLIDMLNWVILPAAVMAIGYFVQASQVVIFEVSIHLGNDLHIMSAGFIQPENSWGVAQACAFDGKLYPILNGCVFGLASTPDIANLDAVL
jgi:hypothetical protein